jgi:hypothetical protein
MDERSRTCSERTVHYTLTAHESERKPWNLNLHADQTRVKEGITVQARGASWRSCSSPPATPRTAAALPPPALLCPVPPSPTASSDHLPRRELLDLFDRTRGMLDCWLWLLLWENGGWVWDSAFRRMPCSASHAKFLVACVATLGPICRFLFISSRLISCYYTSVPSSNTDEYYTSYIVIYIL